MWDSTAGIVHRLDKDIYNLTVIAKMMRPTFRARAQDSLSILGGVVPNSRGMLTPRLVVVKRS